MVDGDAAGDDVWEVGEVEEESVVQIARGATVTVVVAVGFSAELSMLGVV